ncbi:DUF5134 domain-containing protein [Streptomyces sp. OR43]|uniref:DUF5134 domain-containing protein n=1 Tax=Streptomyces sp. or43 TaxID=2478957 RepID=UPI0011CE1C8F|nr:DUF5134 domain-containing protein [Streptomyces sp. or43]TXS41780.1 DUF5134 domain-containing protein [Streptomyces sp. or43]
MSDRTPALDGLHYMLTLLFTLVALHVWRQGVRSPGAEVRDRVDHLLHFTMAAGMAAMPWSFYRPLSGRTTTVLFAAAALWFPLTAFRHRRGGNLALISGRLPSAAGMAAMAWMSWPPPGMVVPAHETLAGGATAAPHPLTHGHTASVSMTASMVTAALTVYLLGCSLWSLTRPMPALRTSTDAVHRAAATDPCGHVRDGAMAMGTAVMLLLPH